MSIEMSMTYGRNDMSNVANDANGDWKIRDQRNPIGYSRKLRVRSEEFESALKQKLRN
jgi:hypothetical protein